MTDSTSYALFAAGTSAVLIALGVRLTAAIGARLATPAPAPFRLAPAFDVRAAMVAPALPTPFAALERYGNSLSALGTALLFASLASRAVAAGNYPLTNMYDFSIGLAMGILAAMHLVDARYRLRGLALVLTPVASALLLYAAALSPAIRPPVPALQALELLALHVTMAIVAYSCFAVGFGAAVLYLLQQRLRSTWLPAVARCDEVGYFGAALGFPFMTLVLALGAYWANQAWGRHWGWDPKESAALATWLVYAAYLHLHAHRRDAAQWLLVVGFVAVLLTYFGNLFLSGLHAYA